MNNLQQKIMDAVEPRQTYTTQEIADRVGEEPAQVRSALNEMVQHPLHSEEITIVPLPDDKWDIQEAEEPLLAILQELDPDPSTHASRTDVY